MAPSTMSCGHALAGVAALLAVGLSFPAGAGSSLTDSGGTGLLQVPSARMLPPETLAAGASWTPLYRHGFVTLQALPDLEVTLRQTTGIATPERPGGQSGGLDLKFRLLREDAVRPEVSIGARSLLQTGGQAARYLVMSRRWFDTDWTLGVGWGRFAQGSPFGTRFSPIGGVEVRTPVDGLSLKLDYTGDLLRAERAAHPGLSRPFPVNVGLAWRPLPWIEVGAGLEQGHSAMLLGALVLDPAGLDRLSSAAPPAKEARPAPGARPARTTPRTAERRILAALRSAGMAARAARIDEEEATVWLDEIPDGPPARTAGRAARIMAARAPAEVEMLTVVLGPAELNGTAVSILRADLERAERHAGSPAEIRRTAELGRAGSIDAPPRPPGERWDFTLTPRLDLSPAFRSGPPAYRATLDAAVASGLAGGFVTGAGLRFNLGSDLGSDPDSRSAGGRDEREAGLPTVRGDLARYADGVAVTADHLYTAWLWNPVSDWHTRLSAGHLDEMFGGWEAEVLYRPFGARWAAGADADLVAKRVPGNLLYVEAQGYASVHASVYYESRDGLTHGVLRAGRYLAGDLGATLELSRAYEGGVRIAAYATVTDAGAGAMDQGISIRIPLGLLPGPLSGSGRGLASEVAVRSLGRDAGQRVDQPLRLYDLTGRSGVGRIMGTWNRLLD
ncbi:YjbH domain-containing protein [Skermanella sp. TT6]|uniref:YjbH domain-containing protein n=1 Tax=Skermanella cutis TaxID=2775420 RepID=A0ABX7B7T5_9PROT|nr:YjbH domain-containing protein [Skermanella sp. TT6]QQP90426.1 YjbH domain-containing protein [Skermanella sp. TT6]